MNDQLDTLNRLITLWMKDLDIVELQQKQEDIKYKAHKSQTTYDWENFEQIRKNLNKR